MPEELIVSGKVVHESGTPKSIKIERGQRGGYGYEAEIRGTDDEAMKKWLADFDTYFRKNILPQAVEPKGD